MNGIEGEINRRLAILAVLYNRRRVNSDSPGVSVWDMERKMAIPREHLDFAVWYLKSKGFISVGENSDLLLTASGVDYVESNAGENVTLDRLLNAGASASHSAATAPSKRQPAPEAFQLAAGKSSSDNG